MSKEKKNGLAQSKNRVQIVGTIEEINLKFDANQVNKNDKEIKGVIAKADFSNPSITIKANGEIYGVEFLPTYSTKRDKDGSIVENPRFKALETLMDYEKGTRVKVDGSFSENGYVGKDMEWKSRTQVQAFAVSSTNVPNEDSTDSKISGIIKNIKEETVGEDKDETGRLLVELYSVDYNGNAFPINLIVEESLAEDFEDLYSKGDSVMLDVELKNRTVGSKKSSGKKAFGNRESKVVEGYTTTEIVVFGGDEAIEDDENQYYIDTDDFKKALKDRDVMIKARIEEKKSNPSAVAQSDDAPKKGLGNRKSAVEDTDDDDDDPFN